MSEARDRACIWMTGRRGAGKSTVARGVVDALLARGHPVVLLDQPTVTTHLQDGLDPIVWLCQLLVTSGTTIVVAADRAARNDRDRLRAAVPGFVELYVDRSDHDRGDDTDDGYEEPFAPEVRVPTGDRDAAASTALVVSWLEDADLLT